MIHQKSSQELVYYGGSTPPRGRISRSFHADSGPRDPCAASARACRRSKGGSRTALMTYRRGSLFAGSAIPLDIKGSQPASEATSSHSPFIAPHGLVVCGERYIPFLHPIPLSSII